MFKREYNFYVYIMSSITGTLYVGMTNNIIRRIYEHKEGKILGFTKKYTCSKLVYYEQHTYVNNAIAREKQIKRWNRKKKEALIKTLNPSWVDLSREWK